VVVTLVVAGLWGVAEATLFFIVPDVWLTWVALTDFRQALVASGVAVAGALVGGSVMYGWGRRQPEHAAAALGKVPGIPPALVARVEQELRSRGWLPMFTGSILAVPYKIYAVKSGTLERSPGAFLVLSVFARAIRFVALACLVSWISNALPDGPLIYRQLALVGVWAIVYVIYFRARRTEIPV
jgi:membrane protein YqaA with SNARE-associated domain